jgi:hypothetical protein
MANLELPPDVMARMSSLKGSIVAERLHQGHKMADVSPTVCRIASELSTLSGNSRLVII